MKRFAPILLVASFVTPVAAQASGPEDHVHVGDTTTQAIDTNLDGKSVPADIGQIFIGNTAESADAITIDSGSNFPPGIAFRRYLGDPSAPGVVIPGTQLGYLDFRGYSGTQFWNAGSLDMVVDGLRRFENGGLPPSKMRFAVSNGERVFIPMELLSNGRLELGAIQGVDYYGPGALGDPKLFVNSITNHWATIVAARPAEGPGYALRLHTLGETSSDYILGGSSGRGTGSFKFSVRGNGDLHVAGSLFLGSRDLGSEVSQLDGRMGAAEAEVAELGIRVDTLEGTAVALDGRVSVVESDVASLKGNFGTASGSGSLALGAGAKATSANSTAIGRDSIATGENALAFGNYARSNGVSAIAHGDNAVAVGAGSVAFGSRSTSTASASTAVGQNARALRADSLAMGASSLAVAVAATAVGTQAVAIAENGTAVGANARATHAGSTALGVAAASTAANQVTLGGAGSSVRVGDIEASTAAQVGPVEAVTVDQYGTLGRRSVVTTTQLDTVRTSMIGALAVSDAQFDALGGRVDGLEGEVSKLFDLAAMQSKETRQGIAAVTALAQPHFPSAAGRTSYASNVGYFRGEVGFSAGLMHRFEGNFAVNAGVSYAGGKNTAARVGVAGEF